MARLFNGSSDYIRWDPSNTTAIKCVSLWFYQTSGGINEGLFYVDTNSNGARFFLRANASQAIYFEHFRATLPQSDLSATSAFSLNAWNHLLLSTPLSGFAAGDDHIYINGTQVSYASQIDGSGSYYTRATNDRWYVGAASSATTFFAGTIADVGVWSVQPTADTLAALAAGFSPECFPNGLLFSARLLGNTGEPDMIGGTAAVAITSPTVDTNQPRVFYPFRQSRGASGVGSTGGGGVIGRDHGRRNGLGKGKRKDGVDGDGVTGMMGGGAGVGIIRSQVPSGSNNAPLLPPIVSF